MSIDVLQEKIRVLKNPTMVGLDPTPEVVPGYLLEEARRELGVTPAAAAAAYSRFCRELLEGAPGDTFGIAGYCVPPMYRQGLADAMEKMCASRARREEMGRIGQRRVDAYFHHEQMLANYQKMYDETAKEYHLE